MTNQNETMIIVSFASQNLDRQKELYDGVQELMRLRPFALRFPGNEQEALGELREAEVLFTWRLTEDMFRVANRLKWVHLGGAGVDQILFPAFRESSITLTNSKGMHGPYIAEWALAALLHISQRFSEVEVWRRDRQWKSHKQEITRERFVLAGQRALIVGYGSVGQAIGKELQAVGVTCEGITASIRPAPVPLHALADLAAIIGNFDLVIVALPLTAETRNLFTCDVFSRMKSGSVFVNVARGKIVDESALIETLISGPMSYAALDVFAEEPLPENSPLFDLPNLFMTPHVSGNYPDYSRVANDLFLANLRRYLNGEALENVVDKQKGY